MVYIEHALRSHIELVNAVHFGIEPPRRGNIAKGKVSANAFRAFATAHNAKFAGSA